MPADAQSAFNEYLNTLGELEGFRESQQCILVGDFNVDFDRGGALAKLLVNFLSELNMCACGMSSALMKEMMGLHVHGLTIIYYYCMLSVLFLSCDQCTHQTFGL